MGSIKRSLLLAVLGFSDRAWQVSLYVHRHLLRTVLLSNHPARGNAACISRNLLTTISVEVLVEQPCFCWQKTENEKIYSTEKKL